MIILIYTFDSRIERGYKNKYLESCRVLEKKKKEIDKLNELIKVRETCTYHLKAISEYVNETNQTLIPKFLAEENFGDFYNRDKVESGPAITKFYERQELYRIKVRDQLSLVNSIDYPLLKSNKNRCKDEFESSKTLIKIFKILLFLLLTVILIILSRFKSREL
jgi:hypothetical protein